MRYNQNAQRQDEGTGMEQNDPLCYQLPTC